MSDKTTKVLNLIAASSKDVKGKEYGRILRSIGNSGLGREQTLTGILLRYLNNQVRYANRLLNVGSAPKTINHLAISAKKAKTIDTLFPYFWNHKLQAIQETEEASKNRLLNNMSNAIVKFVCEANGLNYQEYKGLVFKRQDFLKVIRLVTSRYFEIEAPETTKQLSSTGGIVWKKVTVIKAKTATAK